MFDIDGSLFDDAEFKEDSVREEVIVPILRRLGFSANEPNKIIRSKSLVHPYVMLGSKRHKIYIIPDYLLTVESHAGCILDAKSPKESLTNSKHAEQAYSYAIHPEVRCRFYALCNGKQLVVYDIYAFDPILTVDFADIDRRWDQIKAILSPKCLAFAPERNFQPDFGIAIAKSGAAPDLNWHFICVFISHIGLVAPNLYTVPTATDIGDVSHLISFDLDDSIYQKILAMATPDDRSRIQATLSAPGRSAFFNTPVYARVHAQMGPLIQGQGEQFIPFQILDLSPVPDELVAALKAEKAT